MAIEILNLDFVIIGSGILGLSITNKLCELFPKSSIALLEKNTTFGLGISSRNSEVIHAGIYYPKESLKAKYCKSGRSLIYDLCKKNSIPFNKCGKFLVSLNEAQDIELDNIYKNAQNNEIFLNFISNKDLKLSDKTKHFRNALYSSESGIVDSFKLMKFLNDKIQDSNTFIAYKNIFNNIIDINNNGIILEIIDDKLNKFYISCKYFLNTAGLSSVKIFNKFHALNDKYIIKPCRGRYFSLTSKYNNYFDKLIYPIPDPNGGLGIHLTIELDGKTKLGPDTDWTYADSSQADDDNLVQFNSITDNVVEKFLDSGKNLIPNLTLNDLTPNYIGVRPKLFINNEIYHDFYIRVLNHGNSNTSVHFLGIESPGLTSALGIADDILSYLN